jgi:hypothetical protein
MNPLTKGVQNPLHGNLKGTKFCMNSVTKEVLNPFYRNLKCTKFNTH